MTSYPENSKANMSVIYDADLAGTFTLLSGTYTTDTSTSLANQIQPADDLALRITVTISSMNDGTVDITFNGTDKDDNTQVETLEDMVVGSYETTKWFRTINPNSTGLFIDLVGKCDTVTLTISQTRWGIVGKGDMTNLWISYTPCEFRVGDGSLTTWFATQNEHIHIQKVSTSAPQTVFHVYNKSRFVMGNLGNATTKVGKDGSTLKIEEASERIIYGDVESEIFIYNSRIETVDESDYIWTLGNCTIYNSIFEKVYLYLGETCNEDIYDLIVSNANIGLRYEGDHTNSEKVTVLSCNWAMLTQEEVPQSPTVTFKNVYAYGNNYLLRQFMIFEPCTIYLVNIDTNDWTLWWAPDSHTVHRQYEFDLNVTDDDGTPISNANVTVSYYGEGTGQSFSVMTESNGSFATKTLTMGYYTYATRNTLHNYNPYQLNVSKDGFQDYIKNFTCDAKKNWDIALLPEIEDETESETAPDPTFGGFTEDLIAPEYPLSISRVIVSVFIVGAIVGAYLYKKSRKTRKKINYKIKKIERDLFP